IENGSKAASPELLKTLKTLADIDDASWGQPIEGVSVRIRAEKTVLESGEMPTLLVEARNQARRNDLWVQSSFAGGVLTVDGEPYKLDTTPNVPGEILGFKESRRFM